MSAPEAAPRYYSLSVHGEPPEGVEVRWAHGRMIVWAHLRAPHHTHWMLAPVPAEEPPFPLSREELYRLRKGALEPGKGPFWDWLLRVTLTGHYDQAVSAWRAAGCPGAEAPQAPEGEAEEGPWDYWESHGKGFACLRSDRRTCAFAEVTGDQRPGMEDRSGQLRDLISDANDAHRLRGELVKLDGELRSLEYGLKNAQAEVVDLRAELAQVQGELDDTRRVLDDVRRQLEKERKRTATPPDERIAELEERLEKERRKELKTSIDASRRQDRVVDQKARIASLERDLHEARERAGLFELFDCYEVTVPDGTLWRVEGCYSDGTEPSAWGVCVMHMGEWQEAHAHETRAEAISALRAELALASPEDQGNGDEP